MTTTPRERASGRRTSAGSRGGGVQWLGNVLFCVAAAGCAPSDAPAEGGGREAPPAPAAQDASDARAPAPRGAAVDLSTVMRRAHFGFRPDGEAFSGGHTTYRARASETEVRVSPGWSSGRPGAPPEVAPFVASLEGIDRGGRSLAGPAGQAAIGEDAALLIDRGGLIERLENTESGVEQSFAFEERPEGAGDLRVRILASGEEFLGETDQGLHFVDPATGFGVRYGVATWIDARGEKTPVAMRFADDRIELIVPSDVLEDSEYPAVLDPVIGPELGMDNPVQVPAVQTQSEPVMVYGNGSYLVVWTDLRSPDTNSDIFGVRVAPSGAILDDSSIPIGVASAGQFQPDVAFDGTSWMVVWADNRPDFSPQNIYGARVSASGAVLDPGGIAIATGGSKDNPSIAFDGSNYLVVYTHASAEVRGTFVSTGGAVNPVPFTISTGPVGLTGLAWNGSNYLAVFGSATGLAARRVTSGGGILDGTDIQVGGAGVHFDVASDGVNWMVGFQSGAMRVSAGGALLDPPGGIPVGVGIGRVALTFAGNGYGLFFGNGTNIFGARVSSGGVVVVPATALTSEAGTRDSPAAAFDGTQFLVAFRDNRLYAPTNPFDIFGLRVSPALVKVDATSQLLSRQANTQKEARTAYNGTHHLVVWSDHRAGDLADIWGTRLDATGAVLDPMGIAVSQATGSQNTPSVAAAGSGWLVSWSDGRGADRDIYAARIQANGVNQDPSGIAVNTQAGDQVTPVVASDGSNYMVSWRDDTSFNVWASRVSSAGTVLDPSGIQVSTGGCAEPAIAFNGTRYLVTWTKQVNAGDVYGARLTTAGAVLDAGALAIPISANAGVTEQYSAVGSNGVDFLVAWNDAVNLKVARVTTNGIVLDPTGILVSGAPNNQTLPAVAWDGTQYWVAWQDDRILQASPDIYAARVAPNGAVKDPSGFPVAADVLTEELKPALANGPAQTALLVYHRFDPAEPFGSERVRARFLSDPSPLGAACAGGAQCLSGFCVEGVCCDTACGGTCTSCLGLKKTSGADGTCGPVKVDTDPDNECADQGALSCGTSGSCDGVGGCKLYPAGTPCGVLCAGGASQPNACDGSGVCAASGMATPCAPYVCDAATGTCKLSCVTAADCVAGALCLGGECKSPAANGSLCGTGAECQSGHCVDGVCCDNVCAGPCQACSAAKKGQGVDGLCGPIALGLDPDSECAGQAPSTCQQNGQCNGAGACALHVAGTPCAPATCLGTTETAPSLCDGLGVCQAGAVSMCVPGYTCLGGTCTTGCLTDAECASGYACDVANQWCVLSMGGTGGAGGTTITGSGGAGGTTITGGGGAGGTTMTGGGGAGGAGGVTITGSGGAGGAGASGGTTTASGAGGAGASGGADGGDAGGTTTSDTSTDGGDRGGCGCRTSREPPASALYVSGLSAFVALFRRRRRGAARCGRPLEEARSATRGNPRSELTTWSP